MRNAHTLLRVLLGSSQRQEPEPEPEPDPKPTATPDQRGMEAIGRIIGWLERHPWIIATVPILVVFRILRVAEGDLGTAQVILAAQGLAGPTSLVLLSFLPFAIAVAFVLAVMLAGDITEAKKWKALWIPEVAIVVATFVLSVWFMPALMIYGAVVLGGVLACARFIYNRNQRNQRKLRDEGSDTDEIGSHGWPEIVVVTIMGALAGAVVSAATIGTMWTPAERVTLKGNPTPVVGYVLSEDVNRAVILREAGRTTVEFRSEEIEERQRCELTERQIQQQYPAWAAVPVSLLLYRPSVAYPDCPS